MEPRLQAFIISLPSRTDRRRDFEKAWDASSLGDFIDVQFIPAVEIKAEITGPARIACCDIACAVSHRRAVAMAAARGLEAVLVLEDDAAPEVLHNLRAFLTVTLRAVNLPWHTVNLGGCSAQWRPATPALRQTPVPGAPGIFQVKGMVTTHAILYHRRVYDDILISVPSETEFANAANSLLTCRPYDQWLASHGVMLTGEVPFFVQSGACSDILGVPHGCSIAELIRDTYRRLAYKRNAVPV